MRAMILDQIESLGNNSKPLSFVELPDPRYGDEELLIRVTVCGVCHTELDEIEGRTPPPNLPVIPGHQVVGRVEAYGENVTGFMTGDRVGVAWIYSACKMCNHCKNGQENLCKQFTATGRDVNGGYADKMVVQASFAYKIPDELSDRETAPLLCAGAIGYRSLALTEIKNGQSLGLTGFGASGHLVLKMAKHLYPNTRVYVFARSVDQRKFAKELGAVWAGDTEDDSPEKLDAIIDTTPVWKPVLEALKNLKPGGRLIINAIRKEDDDIDYLMLNLDFATHLWMEKEIKSVANVTRKDVKGMLKIASKFGIKPDYETFALERANEALLELKQGGNRGAKVLILQE